MAHDRVVLGLALALTWLPSAARAADEVVEQAVECQSPGAEERISALVVAARTALGEDDLDAVDAAHAGIVASVPCLTAPISPKVWATHLVTLAVVRYYRNQLWEPALAGAVASDPTVHRAVGAGHPIATWTPPPAPVRRYVLTRGTEAWLNGRAVSNLGELSGPQLLQVRRGGHFRSSLIEQVPVDSWIGEEQGVVDGLATSRSTASGAPLQPPRPPLFGTPSRKLLAGSVGALALGSAGLAVAASSKKRFLAQAPSAAPDESAIGLNVATGAGGWAGVGAGALLLGAAVVVKRW